MENSKDLGFVLIRKDDGTYIKLENVTIKNIEKTIPAILNACI